MQLLCKAKIDKLWESFCINHNILRFEVSKNDVLGMKVADGVKNSSNVKHGGGSIKPSIARQSCEQFSSLNVLEHHIDVFRVLKSGLTGWNKAYSATMFGWDSYNSTSFSEWRCISWFCYRIYCFRMIFSA